MKTIGMTDDNFIDLTLHTQYVYEIRHCYCLSFNNTYYRNVLMVSANHPEYGVSRLVIMVLK